MRKIIAVLASFALVVGLVAAPAAAGKKKKKKVKVHDSFSAQLLPLPNISSFTGTARPGCTAGVQDVHWAAHEFESPGKGDLRVYMEGFTGDWDLYVFEDGDVPIARSDNEQVGASMAPPEEEVVVPLKPKQTVQLAICNWFGEPGPVEAHYEGVFRK